MTNETVMPEPARRPLRIALIDDDDAARRWVPGLLLGTSMHPGPLYNAEIVAIADPFKDVSIYQTFDGCILDWMLRYNIQGPDVAKELRMFNWRRPVIMLLTNHTIEDSMMELYHSVHYMLSKGDLLNKNSRFFWEIRRWAAHMGQVQAAYYQGIEDTATGRAPPPMPPPMP